MTVKEQVLRVLDKLPDDCTVEDVQYRLYVVDLIRRRLKEEECGEFLTQEQAEERLSKWLRR